MAHVKQQIRVAADTILSVTPTNWSKVFQARITPDRDLKTFLQVYCESETLDAVTIHSPHQYERNIILIVQGMARVTKDIEYFETDLDAICEEVETKLTLTAMQAQQGGIKDMRLLETDSELLEVDDRVYASVRLTFTVRVFTTEGNPAI